jgi:DNA-binding XRE family transcriptional regulator
MVSASFEPWIIRSVMNNKLLVDFSIPRSSEQITGKHLKLVRIWAGLRQYEVAARIGIPATMLCEIEGGRREAAPDLVARILRTIEEGRGAKSR